MPLDVMLDVADAAYQQDDCVSATSYYEICLLQINETKRIGVLDNMPTPDALLCEKFVRTRLGLCYSQKGRELSVTGCSKAAKQLRLGLNLITEEADCFAWYLLALCLYREGKLEEARDAAHNAKTGLKLCEEIVDLRWDSASVLLDTEFLLEKISQDLELTRDEWLATTNATFGKTLEQRKDKNEHGKRKRKQKKRGSKRTHNKSTNSSHQKKQTATNGGHPTSLVDSPQFIDQREQDGSSDSESILSSTSSTTYLNENDYSSCTGVVDTGAATKQSKNSRPVNMESASGQDLSNERRGDKETSPKGRKNTPLRVLSPPDSEEWMSCPSSPLSTTTGGSYRSTREYSECSPSPDRQSGVAAASTTPQAELGTEKGNSSRSNHKIPGMIEVKEMADAFTFPMADINMSRAAATDSKKKTQTKTESAGQDEAECHSDGDEWQQVTRLRQSGGRASTSKSAGKKKKSKACQSSGLKARSFTLTTPADQVELGTEKGNSSRYNRKIPSKVDKKEIHVSSLLSMSDDSMSRAVTTDSKEKTHTSAKTESAGQDEAECHSDGGEWQQVMRLRQPDGRVNSSKPVGKKKKLKACQSSGEIAGSSTLTTPTDKTSNEFTREYSYAMACDKRFRDFEKGYAYNGNFKHNCHRPFLVARKNGETRWFKINKVVQIPGFNVTVQMCPKMKTSGKCASESCSLPHSAHELTFCKAQHDGSFSYDEFTRGFHTQFPLGGTHKYALACRDCLTNTTCKGACGHAHSLVEKDVCMLEGYSMITRDYIVEESRRKRPAWGDQGQQSIIAPPKQNSPSINHHRNLPLSISNASCAFPFHVSYTCRICWKDGQVSTEKAGKTCTGKGKHNWSLNRVIIERKTRHRPIIRQPPNGISYNYSMCRLKKGGTRTCPKGDQCTFAHNETEREIWRWMKDNKVKNIHELVTEDSQTLNHGSASSRAISNSQAQHHSVKITSPPIRVQAYHCPPCAVTCNGENQFEKHKLSRKHMAYINLDDDRFWNYREPPLAYMSTTELKMCQPHTHDMSCQYSHFSENNNLCVYAHCREELDEWRSRFEWRKLKRETVKQNKGFSYMDELLSLAIEGKREIKGDIDGVQILCTGRQDVYLKEKDDVATWNFNIQATEPGIMLKRVALLYHQDRAHFSLNNDANDEDCQTSLGQLFRSENENGECCYKVAVQFNGGVYGMFRQSVCFDFGDDLPVLERKLTACVGTDESMNWLEETRNSYSSNLWTEENRNIVRLEDNRNSEFDEALLSKYKECQSSDVIDRSLKENCLTSRNYKERMHRLLYLEELERKKLIASFNLVTQVTPKKTVLTEGYASGLLIAQNGELFVQVQLNDQLSGDNSAGILARRSVNYVLLGKKDTGRKHKVYEAAREEVNQDNVILRLPAKCCEEMKLAPDKTVELEVQFQMDRLHFCRMHYALDQLQDMSLLYPDISVPVAAADPSIQDKQQIDKTTLSETQKQIPSCVMSLGKSPGSSPIVVYGPYGTGKTETLGRTALLVAESDPSNRILICTHTNSAADLFILRYIREWNSNHGCDTGIRARRVHFHEIQLNRIHKDVQPYCSIQNNTLITPTKDDILRQQVVVVTLATSLVLTQLGLHGTFTHIFIDEAAQALECETITPLTLATKETCVLLAGDHKQISPDVYSSLARENGFHKSLLERLLYIYTPAERIELKNAPRLPKIMLKENYRSHPTILNFLSAAFYGAVDVLISRSKEQDCANFKPMSFYCAQGQEVCSSTGHYNVAEIKEVAQEVKRLYTNWPAEWGKRDASQIGVVTCYADQVRGLRKELREKKLGGVTVESIFNVQGKEFKALFISTVRTRHLVKSATLNGEYGFLSNEKLLNAALTRARGLIAVVGDPVALCSIGDCRMVWRKYMYQCERDNSLFPAGTTAQSIELQCQSTSYNDPVRPSPNTKIRDLKRMSSWDPHYIAEPDFIIKQLAMGNVQSGEWNSSNTIIEQDEEAFVKIEKQGFAVAYQSKRQVSRSPDPPALITDENIVYNADQLCADYPNMYKRCILHVKSSDKIFAQVIEQDADSPSKIAIPCRRFCGRAFSGDEVIVEVDETRDGSVGRVLQVTRRVVEPDRRLYVCRANLENAGIMIPIDKGIPTIHMVTSKDEIHKSKGRKICIHSLDRHGHLVEEMQVPVDEINIHELLFVVMILKWEPGHTRPLGMVVDTVQSGVTLESDLDVLNIEFNVKDQFMVDTEEETKAYNGFVIPDAALIHREDHREKLIFTIDPDHSKDLDDALSVDVLGAGRYRVGVHIADVSYFVKRNSPIDKEARLRGTSYYPINREHVPMIPNGLSTDLCSLLPGRDRLAMSFFFILNKDGDLDESSLPVKSVINSKHRLTYREAEHMINQSGVDNDDDLMKGVQILYQLSRNMCERRLLDGSLQRQSEDGIDETPKSHSLVEEMMILANTEAAKLLTSRFPGCIPLRCQEQPDPSETTEWVESNESTAAQSFVLSTFLNNDKSSPDSSNVPFILMKNVWEKAQEAVLNNDLETASRLLLEIHNEPGVSLALKHWQRIQETASYGCSGEGNEQGHHSLGLQQYTHFTSPIRRYIDIVVHRMLSAVIENEHSPYSRQEIIDICRDCTFASSKSKKYEREVYALTLAHALKSKPLVTFPVVESIEESRFNLHFPSKKLDRSTKRTVSLSHLNPCRKPVFSQEEETMILEWQMKICDTIVEKASEEAKETEPKPPEHTQLNPNNFVVKIPGDVWRAMLPAMKTRNTAEFRRLFQQASLHIHANRQLKVIDVTSEKRGDDVSPAKLCNFSQKYQPCMVIKVQLTSEMQRGLLSPCIQLVNITPTLDLCIEHRKNPVGCFSAWSTSSASRPNYNMEDYERAWLPAMSMESASCSLDADESAVVHNVKIKWEKTDEPVGYIGCFSLGSFFCKERNIKIAPTKKIPLNKDKAKPTKFIAGDYLCIRYTGLEMQHPTFLGGLESVYNKDVVCWVGHAITTAVLYDENRGQLTVSFRLNNSSVPLPSPLINQSDPHLRSSTVEWIPKVLPDRRKEEAVKSMLINGSALAKAIACGTKPDEFVMGRASSRASFDPHAPGSDAPNERQSAAVDPCVPGLNAPNDKQTEAVVKALKSRFSLIQGPPGTGKTVTGVRLAYLFSVRNGHTGRSVMYCGPSNKAVDVVTDYMKANYTRGIRPSIIRVYSENIVEQDFPIPFMAVYAKKAKKIQKDLMMTRSHKDVALHHVIRKPEQIFARKILAFDKRFESYSKERKVSPEQKEKIRQEIKDYKRLVHEAEQIVLKATGIILCTCTASSAGKFEELLITQLIIDECGQCTEPESMVPIVAHKQVNQIVLIGDHKQLQPVVKCDQAKVVGLDVSLFERYAKRKAKIKNLIMLTTQYRMHEGIAEFPSNRFYDGELRVGYQRQTERSNLWIWPGGPYMPIAFCHTEGTEETLHVSTAEGSENSKSNPEEVRHAIRIVKCLLKLDKSRKPPTAVILTQYRAQEAQLLNEVEKHRLKDKVAVSTVIASQGSEWDYVVLSTVRSLPQDQLETHPTRGWSRKHLGFITDFHQVNVAITRARRGLVIIGNKHLLGCDTVWKDLIKFYQKNRALVEADEFC